MSENINLNLVRPGVRIWSIKYGPGVVEGLDHDSAYVIDVKFDEDGTYDSYTVDGKLNETDNHRDLYFSEPRIEGLLQPPRFNLGDTVAYSFIAAGDKIYEIGRVRSIADDQQTVFVDVISSNLVNRMDRPTSVNADILQRFDL